MPPVIDRLPPSSQRGGHRGANASGVAVSHPGVALAAADAGHGVAAATLQRRPRDEPRAREAGRTHSRLGTGAGRLRKAGPRRVDAEAEARIQAAAVEDAHRLAHATGVAGAAAARISRLNAGRGGRRGCSRRSGTRRVAGCAAGRSARLTAAGEGPHAGASAARWRAAGRGALHPAPGRHTSGAATGDPTRASAGRLYGTAGGCGAARAREGPDPDPVSRHAGGASHVRSVAGGVGTTTVRRDLRPRGGDRRRITGPVAATREGVPRQQQDDADRREAPRRPHEPAL
jgi:hypothetical protein